MPWSPSAGAPQESTARDASADRTLGTPDTPLAPETVPDEGPVTEAPVIVSESAREPEIVMTAVFEERADHVLALGLDDLLIARANSVWWRTEGQPLELIDEDVAPTLRWEQVGADLALLATEDGLLAATVDRVMPSPLEEVLTGQVIVDIASSERDDGVWEVWLATDQGLYLWRDNLVTPVELQETSLGGANIATEGIFGDERALWVAVGARLFALVESPDGIVAWPVRDDRQFSHLSCDAQGRLWAISEGDIFRRDLDGTWLWLRLPQPADSLKAALGAWVATSESVWYASAADDWFMVAPQPLQLLDVDVAGRALLADASTVVRYQVDAPEPPPEEILTWDQDIAPLFQAHCAQCHGPGKFAQPLHTKEQWIEHVDTIVVAVTQGLMPLPPNPALSEEDVSRILTWQSQGLK